MSDPDEEQPAPFDADVLLSEYGPDNLEAFALDFTESLIEDLGGILNDHGGLPAQDIDTAELRFAANLLLTEPLHAAMESMEDAQTWAAEGVARIARAFEPASRSMHDDRVSRLEAWGAVLGDPGDDPDVFKLAWLRILRRLHSQQLSPESEVDLVVGASYLFTVFRDMAHAVVPALASGRNNFPIH